ncbi:MAG: hypothetical protein J5614_09830 [Paludibacteraceae bacterium]|nr:hypothetical protein [Paludibacteraceae bacterium]
MNRRQKKKLEKRNGHRHYRDYKRWKLVIEFGCKKYGPKFIDYMNDGTDLTTGYASTLLYIMWHRSGRSIHDLLLYGNAYPSSISTPNDDPLETEITMNYQPIQAESGETFATVKQWLEYLEARTKGEQTNEMS